MFGNKEMFEKELEELLNKYSKDNDTETPDWLLVEYLSGCLETYKTTIKAREQWFGRGSSPTRDPFGESPHWTTLTDTH